MTAQPKSIVIYEISKGRKLEVPIEKESVWLTQKQMSELFGKDLRTINEHILNIFDEKELSCFWGTKSISKSSEQELRKIKLGYRAKSIKLISDQFADGEIDELWLRKQSKETIKKEMLKLYGVGPATVWYLLFEVFHFYDSFEHISPWEQKIFSNES